jgi:hypothetical protein
MLRRIKWLSSIRLQVWVLLMKSLKKYMQFWVKETLSKLIPLMVRPFDKLTVHHERNQPVTVRPEPFDYA